MSDKTKEPNQWSAAQAYARLNKYCHYCNEEGGHRQDCIVPTLKTSKTPKEKG